MSDVPPNNENYDYKQLIIILKSLKMGRGKMVSQGSHASLGGILSIATKNEDGSITIPNHPDVFAWLSGSFTKITLGVDTLEELEALQAEAEKRGLINVKITDNGKTEFHGVKTVTCISIGPAHKDDLDFTSHLKLLN